MEILIVLDRGRLMGWHRRLIEQLTSADHVCRVLWSNDVSTLDTAIRVLFSVDKFLRTNASLDLTRILTAGELQVPIASGPTCTDLCIDLSRAGKTTVRSRRTLRPTFDGQFGDISLFRALIDRRAPILAVHDVDDDMTFRIGHPAIEEPFNFTISFAQVISRLVPGIVRLIESQGVNRVAQPPSVKESAGSSETNGAMWPSVVSHIGRRAQRKACRVRDRLQNNSSRWQVAWRQCDDDLPVIGHDLNIKDFNCLVDDGQRFYADPFIFASDQQRFVFVEELPFETGVGIISCFEIDGDGRAGDIKPVLATGQHLSYPYVFDHDGAIWMLPESSAAGGLDLYRCVSFPHHWKKEVRLIDRPCHDATLYCDQGRWWLTASETELASSSWDSLSLYSADDLLGPWRAHHDNPVKIDAGSARPAGPLWRDADGSILRPSQDCVGGYGQRITVNRIVDLSDSRYHEVPVGQVQFAPASGVAGPHTLMRAHGLEVVDFFGHPQFAHRKNGK